MRLASFAPTQRLFSLIALTAASSALPAHAAVTTFVANALEGTVSVVGVRTGAARDRPRRRRPHPLLD